MDLPPSVGALFVAKVNVDEVAAEDDVANPEKILACPFEASDGFASGLQIFKDPNKESAGVVEVVDVVALGAALDVGKPDEVIVTFGGAELVLGVVVVRALEPVLPKARPPNVKLDFTEKEKVKMVDR